MKAFLLAAGHGTRLRPLTNGVPKCLVPIQGVPLLKLWLEICGQYGIDEILINTHSYPGVVKNFIEENCPGQNIYVSEETTLLGSAGTLLANRQWIGPDPAFWVLYADVLTNANLGILMDFHVRHRQPLTMGAYEVANPTECGIVVADEEGIVREFVEKPVIPPGDLAFAGLLVATPEIFDAIPRKIPADIGFDLLPQFVGRMAAYPIPEFLMDIGTPEKYERAQLSWPGLAAKAHAGTLAC
jgi:mannose-1-phosphate guanylyltransferase